MTSLKDRLASVLFFSSPDDALSAELARTEEVRGKVVEARIKHKGLEDNHQKQIRALDKEIKMKRDGFAKEAKPLLEEFDEIGMSQHYYDESLNTIEAQQNMVNEMSKKELLEYGYLSKKLISISLNFEALKTRLSAGDAFEKELKSTLEDAESDDLNLMSEPLLPYAASGIPTLATIRASAFNVARAVEDTGKAPVQEPVRGWMDFLKFRSSFSPSASEKHQLEARKTATAFNQYVDMRDYVKALELLDNFALKLGSSNDSSTEYFLSSYRKFKETAVPAIASDMFLDYSKCSFSTSRFACVENTLKN